MKKLISVIQKFFSTKKGIPSECVSCPECEGTGDFDSFIDCITCDGQGYMKKSKYYKLLAEGNNMK